MNKLQWNLNQNYNIFIQENAFESVVSKLQPFCLGLNVLSFCADDLHEQIPGAH